MTISVVIPTRNRPESLNRLLKSLSRQDFTFDEVIVVDSSDDSSDYTMVGIDVRIPLKILHSKPSVCVQRNLGIGHAQGDWILLCDDDIEVPADYLTKLVQFAERYSDAKIISGLFLEEGEKGDWIYEYPLTLKGLIWNFLFQLPIWSNLYKFETRGLRHHLSQAIMKFYFNRRNTYTLAGWPLLVDFRPPFFQTSVYSLGASLIKKELLLHSPFDEGLDPNGIGDNYGVTLHLQQERPIYVLTETYARHYKSPINRLAYPTAYGRRILALHYFMKTSSRFKRINVLFLLWSLLGSFLRQSVKGTFEVAFVSAHAFFTIAFGKNPYIEKTKT